MVVAIVGSRSIENKDLIFSYLDEFRKYIEFDMIVSGGAIGVDALAYSYAVENGITFVCHPPKPEDGYPKKFFRRNIRIVDHCEILIAFHKDNSRGTAHAISTARKRGKKVYEVIL